MSAETPRPLRDRIDALFASPERNESDVLIEAFEALSVDYITDRGYFPDPDGLAYSALAALAAEGYSIVRDGQAVHEGQVYDLAYTHVRASRELSLRDPDTDEVVGWVSETPLFRLRPVAQGIPATKEQP